MRRLMQLVPSLVVLAAALLAALPLGLQGGARFVMPALPALIIVHFVLRAPRRLPAGIAFAAGLTLDVLTHGPLGYWSLLFLLAHQAAAWLGGDGAARLPERWPRAAAGMAAFAIAEWVVHSVYFAAPAAAVPRLQSLALVVVAYPLLSLLLAPFDGPSPRRQLQLEREPA